MYSFVKKRCLTMVVVAACLLQSCEIVSEVVPVIEKTETAAAVTYTIKKGLHYADSNPLRSLSLTTQRFAVTFDNSAIYTTADPANQGDINKLYGFSDCSSTHHTNSARIGWRWYGGKLELHGYTYANKVRASAFLCYVTLGEETTCEIKVTENQYVFTANGKTVSLPRACSGPATGYQLYPYFGGDEAAPHDITIKIKELP